MARRKAKYRREANAAADQEPSRSRIAADISQQAPHTSWGAVPLFYEDVPITCADCGREEVWTAEQQKWWFETAKGYVFSKAIRCRECREALRTAHGGTPRHSHRDRREANGDA